MFGRDGVISESPWVCTSGLVSAHAENLAGRVVGHRHCVPSTNAIACPTAFRYSAWGTSSGSLVHLLSPPRNPRYRQISILPQGVHLPDEVHLQARPLHISDSYHPQVDLVHPLAGSQHHHFLAAERYHSTQGLRSHHRLRVLGLSSPKAPPSSPLLLPRHLR